MSLTQRLTAVEEIEPWSREASPDSRHRKMSFNPVGTWTEPAGEEQPTIGAFEVPQWKRMRMYIHNKTNECLVVNGLQFRSSSPLSTACSPRASYSDTPR